MTSTRIIAIANQKGGVGKTTTAINLGTSLAMNNKEVLLVDFDPQVNATTGMGLRPDEGPAIDDLLLGRETAGTVVEETMVEGLHVVPGSRALSGLEIELATVENREFLLKESLESFRGYYDFVLIDCPPSLGLLTINALVAAGEVLVTLQSEYYALEGLSHLMETIRNVRRLWNPELDITGVLLTMVDSRLNLSREVKKEVGHFLGDRMFKTFIPRNVKLSEAPSFGVPALLHDARSKGALSYLDLAREVISR